MKKWTWVFIVMILGVLPVAAQRPDAPVYGQRGTFPVGTMDFTIEDATRPLKVTVWYPAQNPDELPESIAYREGLAVIEGRALQAAVPQAGTFPLIVFSHGLGGLRFQSVFYTEHLASHGFVVIATDHPGSTVLDSFTDQLNEDSIIFNFAVRPNDLTRVIDFAENLNGAGGALEGSIDLDNIAVTGHSFGGYTAISVGGARLNTPQNAVCQGNQGICRVLERIDGIASARGLASVPDGLWPETADSRVDAMVLLAPAGGMFFGEAGLSSVTIPSLIIVGSQDGSTIPEENAYPMYELISSTDKTLVTLDNADHYIFVDECSELAINFGLFDSCSDLVWDMNRAHDLINHFTTAFFLSVLKGDETAGEALLAENVDFRGVTYATTR